MHNRRDPEQTVERKLIEAIARKMLVAAEYNGSRMILAPHQLFARHGELFVSALNTTRNWRDDEERRLGHFKLEGLSNVALAEDSFEPLAAFDPNPPRVGDEQVFSI